MFLLGGDIIHLTCMCNIIFLKFCNVASNCHFLYFSSVPWIYFRMGWTSFLIFIEICLSNNNIYVIATLLNVKRCFVGSHLQKLFLKHNSQFDQSCNLYGLYEGDAWFQFWLGHQLSIFMFLVCFFFCLSLPPARLVPQIRPQWLPTTHFPIWSSLSTLSF
jgi:hypothetical protein